MMVAPRGRNRHQSPPLNNRIMLAPPADENVEGTILNKNLQDDNNGGNNNNQNFEVALVDDNDVGRVDDLDLVDDNAPPPVEAGVNQVAREGKSMELILQVVDQKIKDTVESADRTSKRLQKLGRDRKFIKPALYDPFTDPE